MTRPTASTEFFFVWSIPGYFQENLILFMIQGPIESSSFVVGPTLNGRLVWLALSFGSSVD